MSLEKNEYGYGIYNLLKTLMKENGSDLHIVTNSPPRIRISGKLVPLDVEPLTPEHTRHLCYSVLTEHQQKELEKNKELDFAVSIRGVGRFRVNIYHQQDALSAAIRSIQATVPTIEKLGLPGVILELCRATSGLVLVCGATGSGKSTTLAAMINQINYTKTGTIITIEDPVEYVHNHKNCLVVQRELGRDTLSFSNALRAALRQDPDVIMVGEVRDLDTMKLALTAAETGHLVFATMHTMTAISTINRIIDAFPANQQNQVRSQLCFSLAGVVNQLLVPSLKGGRVMAIEVMKPDLAIKNLIRENKIQMIYSSMQTGTENSDMITYNQSILKLVKDKFITKSLGLQISSVPDELVKMFKTHHI